MVGIASQLEWLSPHVEEAQLKALDNVRKQAQRILDKPILFHFTDHTCAHSDRVLANIKTLVADNLVCPNHEVRLNDLELMVLAAAAYLHDIGMQTPIFEQRKLDKCFMDHELAERVRQGHAKCSGTMIVKSLSKDRSEYPTLGLDQDRYLEDLVPIIRQVCEEHSGNEPDLQKGDSMYSKHIRVGFLIAVLRLADALDLNQQRVEIDDLKRFQIPIDSQVHWWRHYYVQSILVEQGTIRVHMCFPSDFSGVYEDYFKNLVLNEINREINLSRAVLYPNWVRFYLDDSIKVSHDESYTRRALPSALKEYIDTDLEKKAESYDVIRSRLHKMQLVQLTKSDWMSFWNFKGNPWTDTPLYYRDSEFVLTQNIEQILHEMEGLKEGKRGELRLIIGERGSGKTTFFNATREALENSTLRIRYVDVLDGITAPRHAAEIYDFLMRRIFECLNIDSTVEFTERALRETIRGYHLDKTVIGIDNLDQFNEDQYLPLITQFFRMSQSLIQDIKSKCILVISCSPKWSEILRNSNLSYLGFRSAWNLRPFNEEEVADLLTKRLVASSLKLEDVISRDAIALLTVMAEGNPRRVVQLVEEWCKAAAAKNVKPITRKYLEHSMVYEIAQQSRDLIAQLARKTRTLSEGVSRIYLFSQDMDRNRLSADRGWTYLATIIERGLPVEEVDGQYETSLSYPATKFTKQSASGRGFDATWLPRPMVKEFFDQWKKAGLGLADFITAYRSEPFVPPEFDSDEMSVIDPGKLKPEARAPYLDAKERFESLLKTKPAPLKAIEESWEIAQLLMEALYVQFEVVGLEEMKEWRKRDSLNRVRMTREERIQEAWNYYKLLPNLGDKVGYIRYFEDIQFLLRKREKVLKTPPVYLNQFTDRDGEVCALAIKKVFAELTGIFQRMSS